MNDRDGAWLRLAQLLPESEGTLGAGLPTRDNHPEQSDDPERTPSIPTGEDAVDSYLSIHDGPEIELKVKGSRFLGQLLHAGSAEAAAALLLATRKRHHAATHHCSAWRVGGAGTQTERFDDDGEPSGTAGAPILAVLAGAELHDAFAVVTRYYGGTKLGTGGLARAYAEAAREALAATELRTVWCEVSIRIQCSYADVGAVEAVIAREAGRIRGCERDFTSDPVFHVTVLESQGDRLCAVIREATAGRAQTTSD